MGADEADVLGAGGHRPHAVDGLGGGQAQGLAAAQGRGGQAPLPGAAAVVGDAEGTALVVVQAASCRGRHRSDRQDKTGARRGGDNTLGECYCTIHFSRESCDPHHCVVSHSLSFMCLSLLLTVTLEPLSDESKQHLPTVVAEGRGPVGVHVERMRPNLEIFNCGRH